MNLCAFDPETKSPAFAVFVDGALTEYGRLHRTRNWDRYKDDLVALAETSTCCVIEDQYVPPISENLLRRVGTKELAAIVAKSVSAIKIGFVRGEIATIFRTFCLPVMFIPPFRWQRCLRPAKTRIELKRMSKIRASDIAGVPITDDNVSDAICIGDFYLRREGFNEMLKEAAAKTA